MPEVRVAARAPILALAFAACLSGCFWRYSRPIYAISGAMLLDGTPRIPIESAVVIVAEGRIAAIGTAGEVRVPDGARRIAVHGRFLFPLKADQPIRVGGPADLMVCEVNPARDPEYSRKIVGRMESGRWTQYPH